MLRTPSRRLLAALAVLSPLVAVASFSAAVVPTDVQMPGTQPNEVFALIEANNCAACHANYDLAVEPGANWQGSMMAHATRDPLFWGAMAVAEQSFDGSGDLCLRCHTPSGWLAGRSTPTDGSALDPAIDQDGVSCDACHRMTNPDTSEWFGVQNAPFLAHDESATPVGYNGSGQLSMWNDGFNKLGPYDDAATPHGFFQSSFHRQSELCGSCHDVSNPVVGDLAPGHGAMAPLPGAFSGTPGTPVDGKAAFNNFPYAYGVVERTFSEHQSSAFKTLPVASYPSLPGELQQGAMADTYNAAIAANPTANYLDGMQRNFSCQSCHMKPVNGKGCALGGVPTRADLPSHDLTGGNYWAPQAIAWLDGQSKLVIGGGMSLPALDAMAAGADRARDNLESAAAIDVAGGFVRVTNLTGHKLISGYPEGRRMWLNIKWFNGPTLIREDGEYGSMMVDIDGAPTLVESILDLDDPNLIAFEAHHGMSQEWADQLLGYGTTGASTPLTYDRVTGAVTETLGGFAGQPAGSKLETFHFVLNDLVLNDTRIPPYGMRYDDAFARNSVPVPDTQYGDPGPGGSYNHWAWHELDIPAGATSATLELLYQPTSWEYIQFLHQANDGSISHLADVGDDLLDAWLATGMAAPHVMTGVSWLVGSGTAPFLDELGALASPALPVPPRLTGSGPAIPGESVAVSLAGGPPGGSAFLVMGFSLLNAPLKGGVLVPNPDIILEGLPLNARGNLSFVFPWPLGATPGSTLYVQYWMQTAQGFAASNGMSITTP
ncbi:MAG: hypothetical protein DRQ55_06940 [Planctomycetota bacterium]|nr:MAG: hypothetical protein DRQ55_06855 [Planctomycetota bacterium]RKY20683.1 MAG: hypothetical protein DRQ55_06940 [Planctomycetota bacterium]